jgi:LuxR family maltose regulon positive regulatory protein
MATPLLKTKLYIPPVRPELVSRPRLVARLSIGLRSGRKLTLVSAPAGFGKTTLVTEWLGSTERSCTWLSLDEGDNDPVRFWTYVIAAIQTVNQELGHEARQIIGSPQLRSAEPAVISLINEISKLTHDLILVLDVYHAIHRTDPRGPELSAGPPTHKFPPWSS